MSEKSLDAAFKRLRAEVALLTALAEEVHDDDAELVDDDEWRAFLDGHPELRTSSEL